MKTKMFVNSLIDASDLPSQEEVEETGNTPVEETNAPEEPATNDPKPVAKTRSRRKAKPYEQLSQMGRHIEAKKAEKKAKREGKIVKKAKPGKDNKPVKPVKKDKPTKKVAKPVKVVKNKKDGKLYASGSGTASGSEHCRVCGKKLTRGTSISDGMGPECARQIKRLPSGTTMAEHYDAFKVVELPKGYLKLKEAIEIARSKGVSLYAFLIAVGGNRMLRPPLNENFQVIVYKNTRYVPKASVSDKELAKIKAKK